MNIPTPDNPNKDLIQVDNKISASESSSISTPATQKPFISRRRFLVGATGIGALLVGSDVMYETNHLTVTQHRVRMQGLKAPCRVVQLSDMHRSWCVSESFLNSVIARTNRLKPDIVALTGDFVTRYSAYIGSCTQTLRQLHPTQGMYAVLGNHDAAADDWKGRPVVAEGLQSIGVAVLTNRNTRLDNGLWIAGIDDMRTGAPDPDQAFKGIPAGTAVLSMTHNPLLFPRLRPFDSITLAGHTHGGQINLPGLTRTMLGEGRMTYKHGWYQQKDGPGKLYVTRGLGVVGLPFRFHAPPEISVFDLEPA